MRILCVCRRDLCRAPIAAAALSARLSALGRDWEVTSAGAGTWHPGDPAEGLAREAAAAAGLDISRHRARRLPPEAFWSHDIMLCMDDANLAALVRLRAAALMGAPAGLGEGDVARLALLNPTAQIPDPYYEGADVYEETMRLIDQGVQYWAAQLTGVLTKPPAPAVRAPSAVDRAGP